MKLKNCTKMIFFIFPCIYTSTKSWRGYIFTSVCLCVCVCVCVCVSVCLSVCVSGSFLVNKIPAERMHRFGRGFRLMVAYCTGSNPIKIGDLGSKVKVPFFLHNSLLTSLLCISALMFDQNEIQYVA